MGHAGVALDGVGHFVGTRTSCAVAWKTCGKIVTAGTQHSRPRNGNSRRRRNPMPE